MEEELGDGVAPAQGGVGDVDGLLGVGAGLGQGWKQEAKQAEQKGKGKWRVQHQAGKV